MFHIHDTVFYPSGGICTIEDIRVITFPGLPERNYYILHPVERPQETFFVPIDSDTVHLRHLIDKQSAEELIAHAEELAVIDEPSIKVRRERIVEAMACHACHEWLRVIRTVYGLMHRDGKLCRVSDTERAYADTARRHLYAELSAVLDIPIDHVEAYIAQHAGGASPT